MPNQKQILSIITSGGITEDDIYISGSGQDATFGDVITDTLTTETLVANEMIIHETTRSILYESGSTKFGDTLDDTHQFTGSVSISGSSLSINENEVITVADTSSMTVATANSASYALQTDIAETKNDQTSNYTAVNSDHGLTVTMASASAITLTIPTGLRDDFACAWLQKGAGALTITGSGLTLNEVDGYKVADGQWAVGSITNFGSETYLLQGRLSS